MWPQVSRELTLVCLTTTATTPAELRTLIITSSLEAQHLNTRDQTAMDTDNTSDLLALNNVNNVISSADKLSSDAVYHQCCSACTSSYKDTLVSASQDETFGKKITIQTPLIGSLGDHPNGDGTFHGSRVMKGNVCVNQSLSSSFDPENRY